MPYRFTALARSDLRDIAAYTQSRWGNAQSDRYLAGLQSICLQLATDPSARQPYTDDPEYYRARAGKHAIFYRIEPDASLLVVRILHATMLPELHLFDASVDDVDDGQPPD